MFLWSCFNPEVSGSSFDKSLLKDTSRIPAGIKDAYIRLLSASAMSRLNLESFLLSAGFADNILIQTVQFLAALSLKDSSERDGFFLRLVKQISAGEFSAAFVRQKVLAALVAHVEFTKDSSALPVVGAAAEFCLPDSAKGEAPGVQSMLVKLIQSGDRGLRVALFSLPVAQLSPLVGCVEQVVLAKEIWPGFSGTAARPLLLSLKFNVCCCRWFR